VCIEKFLLTPRLDQVTTLKAVIETSPVVLAAKTIPATEETTNTQRFEEDSWLGDLDSNQD
jgi:hypothetical protein